MTEATPAYWTLSQAMAWVVFRDMTLVCRFATPDPESWGAYMAYSTTMQNLDPIGEQRDLFKALREGRLKATGRRQILEAMREEIPAVDWLELIDDVDGPYRRLENGARHEPWHDIMVVRADVERLWRRPSEVDGRSRYPKVWFQDRYKALKTAMPASSKNELIVELQVQFQDETKRDPPSRSAVQRYLKSL